MIYVFDNNSLSNILNHYYPERFPTFWEKYDKIVEIGNLLSVREVRNELTLKFDDDKIDRLAKLNDKFFTSPTSEELSFVKQIYSVKHFQHNLDKKKILSGGFFADPFVIVRAWKEKGTVVTEEDNKPNAAKIPNICDHFEILCTNLEGFLTTENWKF